MYISRNIYETCVISLIFLYFLKKKHEKLNSFSLPRNKNLKKKKFKIFFSFFADVNQDKIEYKRTFNPNGMLSWKNRISTS